MHTTEKLARTLEEEGDPNLVALIQRVRAGYYYEFCSELEFPKVELVEDLRRLGHHNPAQLVIEGVFDPTPDEAAAWRASGGGPALATLTSREWDGDGPAHRNGPSLRGSRMHH